MNKRVTKRQPVEQIEAVTPASDPKTIVPTEFMVAENLRHRMAEYCRSVAKRSEFDQMTPPLQHQGEWYLPGVF